VSAGTATTPMTPTGIRTRALSALRLGAGAIVSFLLGASLVFALVLVLPTATGYRSLTVLTGSMEPTLEPGSVVVDEVIHPTEASVGDIVTFTDPANPDRQITHRLRSARVEGDTAYMVTRGDANDTPEKWDVPVDGEIGRVVYSVPKLGYVRALVGTRQGYIILTIGLMLLGVWVLVDLWRPKEPAR
jgi:signal peptidase I